MNLFELIHQQALRAFNNDGFMSSCHRTFLNGKQEDISIWR